MTNDKGFGDVRDFPPSSHYGVIVLEMLPEPRGSSSCSSRAKGAFRGRGEVQGCPLYSRHAEISKEEETLTAGRVNGIKPLFLAFFRSLSGS